MTVSSKHDGLATLDRWLEVLLGIAAAILLFAMMALTCVDVVGRYFLNAPVPGGLEITEYLMAGLIFATLPLVTIRDQHVAIDLLDAWLGRRTRLLQHWATTIVSAAGLAVLSWRLGVTGVRFTEQGDVTAVLRVPLAPLAFFMSLMLGITAVVVITRLVRLPPRLRAGH